MTTATFIDGTRASDSNPEATRQFWLQHAAYGLLLGVSIAVLEFAHYYPMISTPHRLGVLSFVSAFINWGGEGVVFALTVALFERREAPRPLGALQLALAVTIGSVAGVLAWQAFITFVLRELGIWHFRDHLGQQVNWAGSAAYNVWLIFLFGGLAAAVYSSRQRHERMLAVLRAAELSRENSARELADARLAALRTRIDPEFLFQTLEK